MPLSKTDFQYDIRLHTNPISQSRIIAALKRGDSDIDLYWMGTSPEFEESLRPIRIPLYQGLLGYRIFIIHRNHQKRFDSVISVEDLRLMRGIQGVGWSDIETLETAELKQLTSQYESIFGLVNSGKRVDYFSRGIHEAFGEISTYQKAFPNLAIEKISC